MGAPVFVIPLLSLFTYFVVTNYNSLAFLDVQLLYVMFFMLLRDKFLRLDWLGAVVFQLNLKYLHVKITTLWLVIV